MTAHNPNQKPVRMATRRAKVPLTLAAILAVATVVSGCTTPGMSPLQQAQQRAQWGQALSLLGGAVGGAAMGVGKAMEERAQLGSLGGYGGYAPLGLGGTYAGGFGGLGGGYTPSDLGGGYGGVGGYAGTYAPSGLGGGAYAGGLGGGLNGVGGYGDLGGVGYGQSGLSGGLNGLRGLAGVGGYGGVGYGQSGLVGGYGGLGGAGYGQPAW